MNSKWIWKPNNKNSYSKMTWKWATLLLVLLICVRESFAQSPEIVNEIRTDVQHVGRTGRLNCTVARLGASTVAWSKVNGFKSKTISNMDTIESFNRKLAGQYKYEVVISEDVDRVTFMLVVRRLVETDSGRYRCVVRIPGKSETTWITKSGSITVQVAPTINSDADAVVELNKNNSATLHCNATGNPAPNITWSRSDGGLLPIEPRPVALFRGSDLNLTDVDVKDMGVYRCVADNNVKPPSEHLCQVLVFHAPFTRVVQNSVGQAKNRHAKLECIVQGHPRPKVAWWKIVDAKKKYNITDGDKYVINKQTQDFENLRGMEQWYTLIILNVQAKDYTTYGCEGSNNQGNHSSLVVLYETTLCQGANCPSLSLPGGTTCLVPNFVATSLLLLLCTLLH